MKVVNQRGNYRIVDDLPVWGGYYSIEVCKRYGDMECWEKVCGCTTDLEEVTREFDRLTNYGYV